MSSYDLSKSVKRTRRVGPLLVTATLLTVSGAAVAAPSAGRATRSFLVDVEPGTASFGRIDVIANDGAAKTDKTRVAVKVSAALKDANQSEGKADKKKKATAIKDHDLTVDVAVSAAEAAQSVDVPDLNFDGFRDLWLLRELGPNGSRYDVFLFDSKSGKYAKNAFASEIEKLDSPEVEPMSKTLTSRRGGESPSRTTYRVANSRLDVVSSCSFEPNTGTQEGNVVTGKLTQQKLTNGKLETTKKDIAIPRGTNPCAD